MASTNRFLWWRLLDGLCACGSATAEDPELPEDPFLDYGDVAPCWMVYTSQCCVNSTA
jgi:hypothetical protein